MSSAKHIDADALPLGLSPHTVFVTGKGGVGKSTVSAALGLSWRDAGARTLIVEIERQSSASRLLTNEPINYQPVPIAENLSAIRITLLDALREYVRLRLKVKLVADKLVANPIVDQFTQAAPGFRELLVLGKLWSLSQETDSRGRPRWDAVVVDSPATGHGLGLLSMAGVVARMFPVGPISAEARAVDAFVKDPTKVSVVLVSLAEELPVTETLELRKELTSRDINVAATIMNGLLVDRFSAAEARAVSKLASDKAIDTSIKHALDTVVWERSRCVDQANERARFTNSSSGLVGLLPYMFTPQIQRDHVLSLARWLTQPGQEVLQRQLAGANDGPAEAAAVHAAAEGAPL